MAQTYFPFDSGAGANIQENQWSKMAQHWLSTGIIRAYLNELQVYADSTGMQVKAKSGQAWIKGHFYESDAEEVLAISTADASNPRIDRIIIRLDWTENTIGLAVLQGIAATSPTVPAVTQNTSRWEIPSAQVRVNAGALTIAAADITDEREYARGPWTVPVIKTYIDVYRPVTVPQDIINATRVKMLLTNKAIDVLEEFDVTANSRFTAKQDGDYAIYFDINWETMPAYGETILYLYLNGAMNQKMNQLFNKNSSTSNYFQGGMALKYLKKGDVLEFYGYQNTGATQRVTGSVVRIVRV